MNSGMTTPIVQAVNSMASGAVEAVGNAASAIGTATTNAMQTVAKNVPSMNSLIPLGNTGNSGSRNAGNIFTNAFSNNSSKKNGATPTNTLANIAAPLAAANFSVNSAAGGLATPLGIFIGLVVVFLIVFSVFGDQIKQGYSYFSNTVKKALGLDTVPEVVSEIVPVRGQTMDLTVPPMPPQSITPAQQQLTQQSLVEKVLPSINTSEVFNVAQNKFTYYDAEPLCRALGAELATYEQVKEAWNKGADWCNYGWVKGQMAIYPTQKNTYNRLQSGPVDERSACGTVGINGGFFDNPELRYGVNCYGKKPEQSAHDQAKLMEEGKVPRSPATLKIDQLMAIYKAEADSLFVKPFSDEKWSSA